jgi:N-methylhydantoinase B/oxoprolinase/acetone carboxylase alpha subunit
VTGPLNSPASNTLSFALLPLWHLIEDEAMFDQGFLDSVEHTLPEGSVVHPVDPAATGLCTWYTGPRIAQAVARALAQALPETEHLSYPVVPYVLLGGLQGQRSSFQLISAGLGWQQGVRHRDGDGGVSPAAPAQPSSVELLESQLGVLVQAREFMTDSAGTGQYRGTPGVMETLRLPDSPLWLTAFSDGVANPSPGASQGQPGRPNGITFTEGRTHQRSLGAGEALNRKDVQGGETISILYGGGGGWGDPAARPAELRQQDLEDGLISPAGAGHTRG